MEKIRAKIVFGIVGSGWRAEFYLRIARELPDQFEVCGVVTRNIEKQSLLKRQWGVRVYSTVHELMAAESMHFAVVSVKWDAAPVVTRQLSENNIPVLCETPPAPDLDGLIEINKLISRGAKIQVAEQYHLQPLHAARIAIARSGRLGDISHVNMSSCHGYHGISLIRRLMGIGYENAEITAVSFTAPIIDGPNRAGEPTEEKLTESEQTIAMLNFDGRLCIYDFTGDQYFSWIRSNRVLVRGTKGEIKDMGVKYLKDYLTPIEFDLKRQNAGEYGNLEGFYLKGILAGEEWIYKNPLVPAKLSDDEIAIGSCLIKMAEYIHSGTEFYSLAEASQDHYLSMMINRAVKTGQKIVTETQPWVK